ncbi:MAG TPA: hypothetical protein DHU78_07335 [Opitutae bacterium]|nr:hypothetical protein [Opitutae bacterium]
MTVQEDCIRVSKFIGVSFKVHPFLILVVCDSIRLNLSNRLTSEIKRNYSPLGYIFPTQVVLHLKVMKSYL